MEFNLNPDIPYDNLVKNTRDSQQKYINPIPTVMGLIYKDDKLLVVKKTKDLPHWHLVAGFIEPGESAEDGIIREVLEETNLKVKVREIIGTFPYTKDTIQLFIVYKVDYVSGELKPQDDVEDAKWSNRNIEEKFRKGSLSEYIYKTYR